MSRFVHLEIAQHGAIATCRMCNPPRHTLVAEELAELARWVDELAQRTDVRVVVFTGAAEGVFIAHYEVGELAASAECQTNRAPRSDDELHLFHRFLLALERAPFVTIAAINGNAAGGGLEFALGCDFSAGDGRRVQARASRDVGGDHSRCRRHPALRSTPGHGEGTRSHPARAIYEGADVALEAGLAIERREFARCMASEDAATAMRSFLAGTHWEWKGR